MKNEDRDSSNIFSILLKRMSMATILLAGWVFVGAPAYANGRNAALANDFKFFCMRGTPSYESLDAYASALKLPIKKDLSRDMGHRDRLRSRSWTVGSDTGPYELAAAEATQGDVKVETCGIGSADGNGNEIRADLTAHSNFGSSQDSVSPDGQIKTVVWTLSSGERIVLTHAITGPGFYLSHVEKSLRSK
ncbi:hypothetical protein [Paraburkholderia lacunae]|nr:hypothetical protein [Paraburkholderia lacunae]